MTPAQYRDLLDQVVPTVDNERTAVRHAAGRVLGERVHADGPHPRFDNAAVDGFAVTAEVATSAATEAVKVQILTEVAAGAPTGRPSLTWSTTHQVMTGAPVPPTASAVIKVEDSSGFGAPGDWITLGPTHDTAANVRRRGEDLRDGQLLFEPGTRLGPSKIAVLAANGVAEVSVRSRLRVLIVASGDELIIAGTGTPRDGQIFESNGTMLACLLADIGCEVTAVEVATDTPGELRQLVAKHAGHVDLVVTSGGISAGTHESVRNELGENGTFLHLRMKPGGPQGHGTLHGVPVVCLPGNPVSSLVSAVVLLEPIVRGRHRLPARESFHVDVRGAHVRPDLHLFHLARLIQPRIAEPVAIGRSGSMKALAYADVLVSTPPGTTTTGTGTAWQL